MSNAVTGRPQNQQFISLYTDTPSEQQDLAMPSNTCIEHVPPLRKALRKKQQQNRSSSQYCAKQETDECCVVPSAQRLGRLAEGRIGLKEGEQTEKMEMDSDT